MESRKVMLLRVEREIRQEKLTILFIPCTFLNIVRYNVMFGCSLYRYIGYLASQMLVVKLERIGNGVVLTYFNLLHIQIQRLKIKKEDFSLYIQCWGQNALTRNMNLSMYSLSRENGT